MKGATKAYTARVETDEVSIHAPNEGSDHVEERDGVIIKSFNPRSQ